MNLRKDLRSWKVLESCLHVTQAIKFLDHKENLFEILRMKGSKEKFGVMEKSIQVLESPENSLKFVTKKGYEPCVKGHLAQWLENQSLVKKSAYALSSKRLFSGRNKGQT